MRPVDCKARGDTEPLEPEKEDDLQPDSIDLVVFGVTIPMHKFQQQEVAVKMWTSQQDKWQHPLHEMRKARKASHQRMDVGTAGSMSSRLGIINAGFCASSHTGKDTVSQRYPVVPQEYTGPRELFARNSVT
eukprot:gnl/TRDRNA2_/TRDRNA2_59497_c0_seq1.p1 gnl/TRDRNA2_/TRDRNA2_59497_c0~~gnl/TRDRNA2_/TRDRNA2_59497_c0_seq1.p1  ORF type:complete len:132 (-),score=15.56 gnl/TRDRNA2_/TRDRNA2_59497_c0_seq1:39-434(-)